jgi:hypothetical protein
MNFYISSNKMPSFWILWVWHCNIFSHEDLAFRLVWKGDFSIPNFFPQFLVEVGVMFKAQGLGVLRVYF